MDRMIYLAMNAARQHLNGQAQAANNLANASTTAFKADFEAFRAMPMFGDGFFAVQTPDGKEAYTRAGDFKLDPAGQLQTASGLAVIGNGGPIVMPASETVAIGKDGTISTRPLGQEANALTQVDRLKLVKPALKDLYKGEDGLFHPRNGQPLAADAGVQVLHGQLERSNVNPVSEMISMIENSRHYELAVKAMNTAQTLDADGARLLRL